MVWISGAFALVQQIKYSKVYIDVYLMYRCFLFILLHAMMALLYCIFTEVMKAMALLLRPSITKCTIGLWYHTLLNKCEVAIAAIRNHMCSNWRNNWQNDSAVES